MLTILIGILRKVPIILYKGERFMKNKNRILAFAVAFIMMTQIITVSASGSGGEPKSVINLVYDDSGSMIYSDGSKVDRWCQAKYAMEVFAAMLGTNDTMNIYYMSDFESGGKWAPSISLKGADGAKTNVSKLHDTVTAAGNTPFASVTSAYNDLKNIQADEKWLVVLTDGQFQNAGNIKEYFNSVPDDIKVMFLSMGPDAPEKSAIVPDAKGNIFYAKAASSGDIFGQIIGICTRVFNSNKLEVNKNSFSFDVPMSQLVVFAQGEDLKLGSLTNSDGKSFKSTSNVTVKYSEKATAGGQPNYQDPIINKELKGVVATFDGDFAAGDYTLDISGADTVEVYYKPNVDIAAYLVDKNGVEVESAEHLRSGEFTINFGFTKAGTKERVPESKLLGKVEYFAEISNNGNKMNTAISSGDKIYLDEGSLNIKAVARFLEYNSVSTELNYIVYKDKTVNFEELSAPTYEMTKDGIKATEPIQIKASLDGAPISEADWEAMELPKVSSTVNGNKAFENFRVEKSSEMGVFNIYPVAGKDELKSDVYSKCDYKVIYENKHGDSVWSGSMEGSFGVNDGRSWIERNLQRLIIGGISLFFLLLLLGYVPGIKKYLPKQIKKSPGIECSPNKASIRPSTAKGKYKKKLSSTLIPYKAEEGTLRFVPPGVTGVPTMRLKAAGGRAVYIMNSKNYASKPNITFDGAPLPEETTKPVRKSANMMIIVNTKEINYTCIPTNK